jgi:hypothetical protein
MYRVGNRAFSGKFRKFALADSEPNRISKDPEFQAPSPLASGRYFIGEPQKIAL